MFVTLFTSRIVLQTLGVVDFGIHNVVASTVMMFGFLRGTLMDMTQRFISVELGKNADISVLRKIFSTSVILHIMAGVLVVILAGTIGLWFLNNRLVIPANRMIAANWVYWFAVFSFLLALLTSPFTALIISHEDMHVHGYMGIFDVAMRLIAVYLLAVVINADKLVYFALFLFIIACIVFLAHFIYCQKKYKETKFSFVYDKSLIKEFGGFGGYIVVGNIFAVVMAQGTTIMINIFYGPVVNAAKGLANAVNGAVQSFAMNFNQAITPQITMSCAANDTKVMWNLVGIGTRMTYFLLLVFSVPFLLETEFILQLWLGNVPEYTSIFVRLMIIEALINRSLSGLHILPGASGKLRLWCCFSYTASVLLLVLFYLICRMGYSPQYVLVVFPLVRLLFLPIWIILSKKLFNLSFKFFVKKMFAPVLVVSMASFLPFYFLNVISSSLVLYSWVVIPMSIVWTGIVIMLIGLGRDERVKILAFVKQRFISN